MVLFMLLFGDIDSLFNDKHVSHFYLFLSLSNKQLDPIFFKTNFCIFYFKFLKACFQSCLIGYSN